MSKVFEDLRRQINNSNFTFPEDLEEKKEFLTNIGPAFKEIHDAPLVEIEKFQNRVIEVVPEDVVKEGKQIAQTFPARFHLWSKKHPILGVIVKILSLGVLAIVGYVGKKRLSRPSCKAHLDQIAVAKKVQQRKNFLSGIKDKNLEQMPLSERQTFVARVVRDKESLGASVFEEMRENIQQNAERDLNSPVVWRTKKNVEALQTIYTDMECPELHEIVSERWKLLSQVRKWSELLYGDKKDLIDELEKLSLSKRAELILFVVEDEESSQTLFSYDMSERLKENAEKELSSPDLWKNKKDVKALFAIYSSTNCTQLEEKVKKRYSYLTYVRGWDQLQPRKQESLIDKLVQMPIPKRAELILFLVEIEDDIDSSFFQDLSVKVQGSVEDELSSPDLYFDEDNLTGLQRIYSVLKFEDAEQVVAERSELIQKVQNLETISIQERSELLEDLIAQREVFEAQLIAVCYEFEKGFTFDGLLSLSEDDAKYFLTMFNSICELDIGLDLKSDLKAIEDEIRVKHLIEAYRKGGPEKIDKITVLSELFSLGIDELSEQIESVYNKLNLPWNVSCENLENHKALLAKMIANEEIFDKELDAVRASIFGNIPILRTLKIENAKAVISELLILKPVFEESVKQQTMKAQVEVLLMARVKGIWEDGQKESRAILQEMCEALSFDEEFINLFQSTRGISSHSLSSRSADYKIKKVNDRLLKKYYDLRCRGTPTDPEGILESLSLPSLTFSPFQKVFAPPKLKQFEGKVDILNLIKLLRKAPEGVIPTMITDSEGKEYQVSNVLINLNVYFVELLLGNSDKKAGEVLNILRHYTHQVEQRLASANQEEKAEIYLEIKQYILESIGSSTYYCDDRKFNAAKVILREKIPAGQADLSTPELVNTWVAEKRDECVTQMLIELITKNAPGFDLASRLGYWKYKFQDEFKLGAIPKPAHKLEKKTNKLEIQNRFNEIYTPERILDLAMDEYNNGGDVHKALRSITINEFLEDRFENYYTVLVSKLFDEVSFELKREAMALYLQECGIFSVES